MIFHLGAYNCVEVIFVEEKQSTITYDDNWREVSTPEIPVLGSAEDYGGAVVTDGTERELSDDRIEKRHITAPRHLVLTLQLAVCLLLALAAFALKSIGGEVYEAARAWYIEQLNDTAMFDGSRDFGLPFLNGATADEV